MKELFRSIIAEERRQREIRRKSTFFRVFVLPNDYGELHGVSEDGWLCWQGEHGQWHKRSKLNVECSDGPTQQS